MVACVCLAVALLLVLAVLILYGDLPLLTQGIPNRNSHNLEGSLNRLRIATLQY
jgi:hypothetical protein